MKLEFTKDWTGRTIASFTDEFNRQCKIEESDSSGRVWVGLNKNLMLLTQEQVAALLPLLQRFAETGELGERGGLR